MQRNRSRRLAGALAAAAMGVLGIVAVPSLAGATPGTTYWVNDTVPPVAGHGTSCVQPGYSSVQAAVNAAEGHGPGTILLCPGTYQEQVQVTGATRLTIRAAVESLGATLELPANPVDSTTPCDTAPGTGAYQPDQDGFAVCGNHGTTITVKGITFDEAWPGSDCYDSLYGILVGGNDTLNMSDSAIVAGGAYPINGCQGGIGIQDGMGWTTPNERGHLTLTNVAVSGYQKNGITIDGQGTTANLRYDTVEGAGPTTQTAQNGIQVSNGAYATIAHSTIEGNECNNATCGANAQTDYQAGGILFYGARQGSSVTSCVIKHNDYGIYFYSQSPTLSPTTELSVKFSTIANNRYEDVLFDQGRNLLASDRVTGGQVGIMLLQYDGQSYGDYDTVVSSQVRYSTHAAVQVLSDQAATGDLPGALTFRSTNVRGPILSNSSSYTVSFIR